MAADAADMSITGAQCMPMGTGVNAQQRLVALHHLDVPWLVSDIEQREGRIERQGNQNEEIGIYAYALQGSVDATSWQLLERKIRFIALAMSGDRSIRRLEDVGSDANQFAMAKALASGDPRLMQKAGLEAEIARLDRMRAAHFDDQQAVRRQIARARHDIDTATRALEYLAADIERRRPTRGELFSMQIGQRSFTERKQAGASLLSQIGLRVKGKEAGLVRIGHLAGFDVSGDVRRHGRDDYRGWVVLELGGEDVEFELGADTGPLGIVARLENALEGLERTQVEQRQVLAAAERRLPGYEQRLGGSFEFADELALKQAELAALEASLEATKAANDDEAGEGAEEAEAA